MDVAAIDEVLAMPEYQFKKSLQGLPMEEMVSLLKNIQGEMGREQAHFNSLKAQQRGGQEGAGAEDSQVLMGAMVDSQNRLSQLMDRTTICFSQQSKRPEVTKSLNQRPSANNKAHMKSSQQNGGVGHGRGDTQSKLPQNNQTSHPANKSGDKSNGHSNNSLLSGGSQTTNNNNITKTSNKSHTTVTLSSNHINSPVGNSTVSNASSRSNRAHQSNPGQRTTAQQPVYSVRSIKDRNANQDIAVNPSSQSDEEKEPISVASARNLFESGSSKSTVVKRNFSIGSRDNVNNAPNQKGQWKLTEPSRPYRSASMHNLHKSVDVGGGMSVKDSDTTDTGLKKSSTTMTITNNKSNQSTTSQKANPMGRIPVVRTAWSQQPKPSAAGSATAGQASSVTTQNPPLASKAKVTVTTKSTPHLASKKVPENSKTSNRKSSSSLHPLFQTLEARGEMREREAGDEENGHTFDLPKLKPVDQSEKVKVTTRRHSTGKADVPTVISAPHRQLPDDRVPLTFTDPMTKDSEGFHAEDDVQQRVTLKNWDPTPLLEDLYQIDLKPDHSQDDLSYTNIEGYMEKLPMNKKKATLLKTWRKRYFKAKDGNLYYYESGKPKHGRAPHTMKPEDLDKATGCLPLCGGHLEDLGERMLGLDDGRGRYLVVRCANDKDFHNWKTALDSQVLSSMTSRWVKPLLSSPPHPSKNVVVIDLGSCSVRAGILGETPSLPQLFFPTLVGVDTETGENYVGLECTAPNVRDKTAKFIFPVRPSVKVDKFSMNMDVMPAIFKYVFKTLNVNPKDYWVMLSAPANLSDRIKEAFMDVLVRGFSVKGVNIVHQTLLALYSYSASSGVVVDIGERLEILPVTDGYIVEQGVSRQPYGGHRIAEALNSSFTEKRYRFFTDVEFQIVRMAMEKLCVVSEDYSTDLRQCNEKSDRYKKALDLEKYHLPKGSWTQVSNDVGWFKGPEGLFNLEVWGMDNPPLQKLIQTAIGASPMDTRREMWRSIYLSGGVTLLPGFVNRLETELKKLAPPSVTVEIHASPQRYHSAYIGACALAGMGVFEQSCISAEEWNKTGASALRKWHMY